MERGALLLFYTTCIQPIALYAAPAGCLYISSHGKHKEIERIQRRTLKLLFPEHDGYLERLAASSLPNLNYFLDERCFQYTIKIPGSLMHFSLKLQSGDILRDYQQPDLCRITLLPFGKIFFYRFSQI